jgi:glycosyltransferase involved in cell wall biosynthesis
MKLGFYYHIPAVNSGGGIKVPSFLGLFIDSLASEVESLTLFLHSAERLNSIKCDYILKGDNINYVNLGPKTPAWERFLLPWKTLKKIRKEILNCDTVLVRAPSPLAPRFYKSFHKLTNVAYLVVGDYSEGIKHLDMPWWRKIPIQVLSKINDYQLESVLKRAKTMVNSTALFNRYRSKVPDLSEIRTTTISSDDFYHRNNTCLNEEIKVLYTGSFSSAKGLIELLNAFSTIFRERSNVTLHFAGWDYSPDKSFERKLSLLAADLGIADRVKFHGFKTTGPELNAMYQMADIYVIPSYHEGFPRTIWEAMANSLPVIATKVGSIPHYLKDHENSLLIPSKDVIAIVDAINEMMEDGDLRAKLIINGRELAKENTLENQTKRIVSGLSSRD